MMSRGRRGGKTRIGGQERKESQAKVQNEKMGGKRGEKIGMRGNILGGRCDSRAISLDEVPGRSAGSQGKFATGGGGLQVKRGGG